MNTRPIELAHDADLRFKLAAINRSALRARALAMQTSRRGKQCGLTLYGEGLKI